MDLLLFSVAPIFLIMLYIYLKDKYEKEPMLLLFYSFLLGAFVSIIITTAMYIAFDHMLPLDSASVFQQFIRAFFIVGFTEEFSKYVIVRYYAQPKIDFNEPFDGIVYAVMVSMGFAATENIFYVLEGGYEVALLRSFTAIPAHATFAILMGYYMGQAKFSEKRIQLNLKGLLRGLVDKDIKPIFLFRCPV